jgi:hypothetical protein
MARLVPPVVFVMCGEQAIVAAAIAPATRNIRSFVALDSPSPSEKIPEVCKFGDDLC